MAIDSLDSVSCASPGNCSTGGAYFEHGGPDEGGLLLTETDGHWTTVAGLTSTIASMTCGQIR